VSVTIIVTKHSCLLSADQSRRSSMSVEDGSSDYMTSSTNSPAEPPLTSPVPPIQKRRFTEAMPDYLKAGLTLKVRQQEGCAPVRLKREC